MVTDISIIQILSLDFLKISASSCSASPTRVMLQSDEEVDRPDGGGYSGGLCVFCPPGEWSSVPLLCLSLHPFNIINISYSGILITGGSSSSAGHTVELYVPSTGQHCQLPDLPDNTGEHTLENLVLCGGWGSTNTSWSCLTLTGDGWERTTTLLEER